MSPFLFFLSSFNADYYLRRMLCSPLGKEMGDLKIFKAASLCHIYPSVELRELKREFSVVVKRNIHKLSGKSLSADKRIKLGSEHGGKYHIYAVIGGCAHKAFDDLPMLFRERFYAVVVGDAIGIEPLGMYELLLWQDGIKHSDLYRSTAEMSRRPFGEDLNANVIFACGNPLGQAHLYPKRAKSASGHHSSAVIMEGSDKIGIHSGLTAKINSVLSILIHGLHGGDMHHVSDGGIFRQ